MHLNYCQEKKFDAENFWHMNAAAHFYWNGNLMKEKFKNFSNFPQIITDSSHS